MNWSQIATLKYGNDKQGQDSKYSTYSLLAIRYKLLVTQ